MVLRDIGRIGHTQDGPIASEQTECGRKRRRQAFALLICATACWGLVALLYYCVALTEIYWPWS